ncbi:RNA polymerase sigma factor [Phytopseudomonas dryadis]|uniref:Sigma-70 family RNA polymerase sigma factor n=1 Tax=Phytopseudomonas dryadis TaxID=2487520 RepID=A0A4V2KBK2_9GAMM|nr:sigma-70 family RNA polymerase sigma factor [Pseudomonas dryadis]TBU86937.1 sigma-70 family RNA polymerase sigma factor [Pseudomonas dryadis]
MSSEPSSTRAGTARKHPLDELASRYYAPLLSFFRKRLRDSSEAQDLVQQVFLRLSQNPGLSEVDRPDAYIFQTASNALKDLQRRQEVRQRHGAVDGGDLNLEEQARSDLSPERVLMGKQDLTRLVAALRGLPERTRDIFMLRYYEGLKHTEIAHLHGISVRAVEKHVAKALAQVSRAVE